jgi:hypothetical protein
MQQEQGENLLLPISRGPEHTEDTIIATQREEMLARLDFCALRTKFL